MELNDVLGKTAEELGLDTAACNQLQDKGEVQFERLNGGEWIAGLWHFVLPQSKYRVAKDQTDVARQTLIARFWHQPAAPTTVSELAPLTQEWLSASKVCTFEPAEGTAFTHRWDGFEVERDAGEHEPSFPMAGKWGMSSGADDYGRTTFRNPLKD